ncbi:protein of unknown function [Pararobbsia alpina]
MSATPAVGFVVAPAVALAFGWVVESGCVVAAGVVVASACESEDADDADEADEAATTGRPNTSIAGAAKLDVAALAISTPLTSMSRIVRLRMTERERRRRIAVADIGMFNM